MICDWFTSKEVRAGFIRRTKIRETEKKEEEEEEEEEKEEEEENG